MKLDPRAFRIEWDLHAWVGAASSLLLFVIFFCGVFSLFRSELALWQDPALHAPCPAPDAPISYDALARRVDAHSPIPTGARLVFERHEASHWVAAWVFAPEGGTETPLWIEPHSGQIRERHSRLADELYEMHFLYRLPLGLELSGALAAALFIALVTGVLIQLKNLRRQLWQFRPSLRLRFSGSDAHKVLGIFGLPFAVLFAWTGTLLGFLSLLYWALGNTVFGGDLSRLAQLRGEAERAPVEAQAGRPQLPLDVLVERARTALPGRDPAFVQLDGWNAPGAGLEVYFVGRGLEDAPVAAVDAATGDVLQVSSGVEGVGARVDRVLLDLHYANGAGLLLKVLYALLAWGVCAVIVTGNLIWIERRDPQRAQLGNRLLERLTVAVPAGLMFACAAYFAANRTLPELLEGRAHLELSVFLLAWALTAAGSFWPRIPAQRSAGLLCSATGLLFGAVLALDVTRMGAVVLLEPVTATQASLRVVEGLLLAHALGIGAIGLALLRREAESTAEVGGGSASPAGSDG